VIKEIRELMLDLAEESVSTRKMDKRKPARGVGMMQQQQWRRRGAEGQLQEKVWDPSGFQPCWKSHEQELMIFFFAVEYDAGTSLHLKHALYRFHAWCTFKEGEASPSHFFFLKNPRRDPGIN
jgi:hypothetical protein